jgi:4-hydroxy-tetrahydrodipicolinate reductase
MKKIILNGCNGKMGKVISSLVADRDDCEIVAGVDKVAFSGTPFPQFADISSVNVSADAIIDFSHPSALDGILDYAISNNLPVVLATTGYTDEDIEKIDSASKKIPVFFSANMSLGINLLSELAKKAAEVLGDDFNIEIVEMHHNQKIDSPSGTALLLADEISSVKDNKPKYEYDRHSKRQKRDKNEIGIHSVRGGTIVGEHEVIFAGHDEIITLSHSARSKEIFASGAVNAAIFMADKTPGLYNMGNLIK